MSLNYEDEQKDCLLAAADDLDIVKDPQPAPSSEILGVVTTPTSDAKEGTVGMAPPEGSGVELHMGQGLC